MLREKLRNITIKDLLEDGKISVRTSNCCINAGFQSLMDLIEYYETGQRFLNIKNAGRKACFELETLCKEYTQQLELSINVNDISEDEKNSKKQNEIENLIKTDVISAIENKLIDSTDILTYLNNTQKEILEKNFDRYITAYSIRTMNRLNTIGFEIFVIEYLFASNSALLKIKGLGKKSLLEAIDLKNKMKEDLTNLIHLSEEDLSKLNLFYQKGDIILNDFVTKFYNENNHLPMFWILEQQFVTNENRSFKILVNTFPIFQNYHVQTLDEIAKKFNLTSERVRQIRNDIFRKTLEITDEIIEYKNDNDLIKYFELLQNKDDWAYILELLQDLDSANQESFEIQGLLKKEQCNLSAAFILQIIAYVFRDKFKLLGGFSISNNTTWENTFLLRKEHTDIFNFDKFVEEFSNYIANNETEYDLDVEKFLSNSNCWISVIDLNRYDSIIRVIKDILLYKFHLYSNLDGLITIPATKQKSPLNVVYEVLQQNGSPMHLNDIFIEFKKEMPDHKYTEAEQLRSCLQRHEAISYRNRKSVYTLKEWEHIKSGTIRDAIVEFLSENNLPQTSDNITDYVLQYFPKTNIASVRTTMFNDTQKRFSFFNNNLFGLANKEYPPKYEAVKKQAEQRRSFEQRLYDFEKFLNENDHFPFSTSYNEDEISLYRWWRIQNKRTTKLSVQQKTEIERIKLQYADFETDKTIYEWFLHLNDFKRFILENHRFPSSNGPEKFLYGWFNRAKDNFLNNRLNDKQRTKYAELFKEIRYVER